MKQREARYWHSISVSVGKGKVGIRRGNVSEVTRGGPRHPMRKLPKARATRETPRNDIVAFIVLLTLLIGGLSVHIIE